MDSFHAGCLMGQHLARCGALRITFVARPEFPSSTNLRLAGVREGARLVNPETRVDFKAGHPEDQMFVDGILRERPLRDAFVCANDLTAAHLMNALGARDVSVPDDLRLAGFDDAGYATLLPVPLTTVRQPCRAMGIACISALLGRIRHPELPARSILLPGELVIRASTGPHPGIVS
jgi:DNA-binding LacI/PurR family transcriptional regulator